MSEIRKLIQELCPSGVEFKKLGEIGTFTRGSGLQKKDFTEEGFPCIHYGQIYTKYGLSTTTTISKCSPELAEKLIKAHTGDLVIACTSENVEDVCKAVVWLGDGDIVTGGHSCVFSHDQDPKYVAYFFQSEQFFLQKKRYAKGVKVIDVKASDLERIEIPVPPMEVQCKIVEILDNFSNLTAELEAELEERKRQYEYYRNLLLSFSPVANGAVTGGKHQIKDATENRGGQTDVTWMKMSEICSHICSGGTPLTSKPHYYNGNIPWLRTQEVDWCEITDTSIKITEEGLQNSSAKMIPANCVIVAMYGATAAKVAINRIPLCTNQACCNLEIDESIALVRYVYQWLCREYENLKSLGEGSQHNINANKVKSFPIPIPSLEEQQRIVDILDRFETLTTDLQSGLPAEITARRQQYEYYREQLLTFKRKSA